MEKNLANITLKVLIIMLIASNVFFSVRYFSAKRETRDALAIANASTISHKVLDFTAMFVNDVLKADKEVSFETRLALETKVRDLKDEEIITRWQNFTESETEDAAQENVKKLLEVLIAKIKTS